MEVFDFSAVSTGPRLARAQVSRAFLELFILLGAVGVQAAEGSANLSWEPNPESDIAGYRVYYGTPPGRFDQGVDVGKENKVRIGNLNAGRAYGFRITSFNELGLESHPSATQTFQTPGVDLPPQAFGSTHILGEGETLDLELQASDPENFPLTFTLLSNPTGGSLTGEPPYLKYRSDVGNPRTESFRFRVSDGLSSTVADVVIHVIPQANDHHINLDSAIEDQPASLTVPAVDEFGVEADYAVKVPPRFGTLTGSPPEFVYQPRPEFSGIDDFVLVTTNSQSRILRTLVKVQVAEVDDPPTALDADFDVEAGSVTRIVLKATDVDTTRLKFKITKQPTRGVLAGTAPDLLYVPNFGIVGLDSFQFTVSDLTTESAPASVTIRVEGLDPAQIAEAGIDQVVTLPGVGLLRGSIIESRPPDSDKPPVTVWQQAGGPGFAEIANLLAATTPVTFFTPGRYEFEFLVTSDNAVSADRVVIEVKNLPGASTTNAPFTLFLDAERGEFSPPMSISSGAEDEPFAPLWVSSNEPDAGAVRLDFEVPEDGEYIVWCRAFTHGPGDDSFRFSLDADPATTDIADLGEWEPDSIWRWTLLAGRGGVDLGDNYAISINPRVFNLTQGFHFLTFHGRDPRTRLDAIAITQDPNFDPRSIEYANDQPMVAMIPVANEQFRLEWNSIPGRRYAVVTKTHLNQTEWTPLGSPIRATATRSERVVPGANPSGLIFYAVVSVP